jgi:hypothetical protein
MERTRSAAAQPRSSRWSLLRCAFIAAAALATAGPVCGPAPPPAPPPVCDPNRPPVDSADDVKDICSFIDCLNAFIEPNEIVTIADTVQCLPPKCTVTLTQSGESAQPACSLGDRDGDPAPRCPLPRILLDCPGPPRFMPSYSLCPVDRRGDVANGHAQASNRVELGEAVDAFGNMRMADVEVEPGPYEPVDAEEAVSKKDGSTGTKNCNECHGDANENDPEGHPQLSDRLEPTGGGLAPCIIDSDDCRISVAPGQCDGEQQSARSLAGVCDCIAQARVNENHPLAAEGERLETLCRALETYRTTRGACVTAGCPSASGPECTDHGLDCDPASGATVQVESGYKCQLVDEDQYQCVAECPCREYDLLGGGKFLVYGQVSMVRLELSSSHASQDPDEIVDAHDIAGELAGFNYVDHRLIESVSFETLQATRSGADFAASGTGTALVNGVTTPIEFDVSQTGSSAMFEVRDALTSEFLAGGVGEDERAGFALTVTP